MKASLDDLIKQPGPWLLTALDLTKVYLAIASLVSVLLMIVGAVLELGGQIWLYVFFALLAGATIVALFANKWSEGLFVRRAEALGFDRSEARHFYRIYDWDQADA